MTIIGFVGMLRPHTFPQLCLLSFTLVVKDKHSLAFSRQISGTDSGLIHHALRLDQQRYVPLGFYIKFKAKTIENARAYFPNLSVPTTDYHRMCPVDALRVLVSKGLWKERLLRRALKPGPELKDYMKSMPDDDLQISPHALRIGGRTWYITQGLDRQFVDFLGTWVSPEASARYYRESPAAVIRLLQKFFKSLPHPRELY